MSTPCPPTLSEREIPSNLGKCARGISSNYCPSTRIQVYLQLVPCLSSGEMMIHCWLCIFSNGCCDFLVQWGYRLCLTCKATHLSEALNSVNFSETSPLFPYVWVCAMQSLSEFPPSINLKLWHRKKLPLLMMHSRAWFISGVKVSVP